MDDTNPTKEDVEYVDSITADVKWLIAGWADHCLGLKPVGRPAEKRDLGGREDFYLAPVMPAQSRGRSAGALLRLRLLRAALRVRARADPQGQGLRLRPHRRGDRRRCAARPTGRGRRATTGTARWRRTSTCSADARRRVPRRRPHAAREDRHGAPNVWLRDPVLYRIRHASHHHTGDAVVHLPDVRLRARPERLHRGHHPQHLHARVRGAPAAVRLDPRGPRAAPGASRASASSPASTSPTR